VSIKSDLQEFYAKQGITGKHLRKAIQWDMKAARRNSADRAVNLAGVPFDTADVGCAFAWALSPEGTGYWCARCNW
jgi:hypothetical protein